MPYIPVPNTAKLELFYTLFNQKCENTLYFEKFDDWNAAEILSLAQEGASLWPSHGMLHLSNECAFTGAKATALSSQTGPTATVTGSGGGALVVGSLPSNVAFCIKFSTQGRGRSSQGRIYLPGIPITSVLADAVIGARAFEIEGDMNDAIDLIASDMSATHVVVSRYHNHAPRTEGVTYPVTNVGISDVYLDSQRRRLIGRGR